MVQLACIIIVSYSLLWFSILAITGSAIIEAYYTDGTLLLSHGGVEMGQGLDTKMMQIAALELNVPMGLIRVTANSTDKVYSDT